MDIARRLIVNADDFGLAPSVNDGIIAAHARGIVTGTSLMVRAPGAMHAAVCARAHPRLDVGLHLDFGEWVYRDDNWVARYEVVPLDDAGKIMAELERQLDAFRHLLDRDPTHLDSHQHVHLNEPLRSAARQLARQLNIPLRGCDARISYCGAFYGQSGTGQPFPEGIRIDSLLNLFHTLPEGITELGCHPGAAGLLNSVYSSEREQELRVLTDWRARQALQVERISLCSFRSVANVATGVPPNPPATAQP